MPNKPALVVLITASALQLCCARTPDSPKALVFAGATLIDGTGSPPVSDAAVVVRGDRIVAVGRGINLPKDATVVDARGKWLIPGMVDVHVHFMESARPGAAPTYAVDLTRWFPWDKEIAWMKVRIPFTLARYVCSGVTTVAILGAIPWEYDVQALAATRSDAPRVLLAGGYVAVGPASEHDIDPIWDGSRVGYVASAVNEIGSLLDTLTAKRVDLIKAGLDEDANELPPFLPVMTELIRQSHARGYRVAVHALNLDAAKAALTAGADVLAHTVSERAVDDEFLQLASRHGATNVTTLGLYVGASRLLDDEFVPEPAEETCGDPQVASTWRQWTAVPRAERPIKRSRAYARQRLQTASANVRRIHDAGIPIAVGSDGGNIGTQHGPGFHRELRLMAQAGLTPMDILVAATRNGARALGRENDLGTVQSGKLADLIVLDADPLQDVANIDHVVQVVVRGKVLKRQDLNAEVRR